MNRRSGNALILVLIGILSVAILTAGYFFLQNNNQKLPPETTKTVTIPSNNANALITYWNTYKNIKYNFLIDYPPPWSTIEVNNSRNNEFIVEFNDGSPPNPETLAKEIIVKENWTIDQQIKEEMPGSEPGVVYNEFEDLKDTKLLDIPAKTYRRSTPAGASHEITIFQSGQNLIMIMVPVGDKTFEQIVHRFRLLGSDKNENLGNWKTFTIEEYKLALKYPPQWQVDKSYYNFTRIGDTFPIPSQLAVDRESATSFESWLRNLPDYARYEFSTTTEGSTHFDVKEISLGTIKGYEFLNVAAGETGCERSAAFYSEGYVYTFTSAIGGCSSDGALFDKVLSTVQFVVKPSLGPTVDAKTVKVGDKVGALTVKVARPFRDQYSPITSDNAVISFSGLLSIKGKYVYHGGQDLLSDTACFEELDEKSLTVIPTMVGDERSVWFCFDNQEEAGQLLKGVKSGSTVNIQINNYSINYYPSEVYNTATLIRVIN